MVFNLHLLVAPKTRPPPCFIQNISPFKIKSYSPPSPPRGKNNSRSTVRNASLEENLGKRRPPRFLAPLDCARQSCAPGQRTPYDVQIALDAQETRLVLSNTLRMEIRPAGGDTRTPQGRWFCARSFKTAVGSRLKTRKPRRVSLKRCVQKSRGPGRKGGGGEGKPSSLQVVNTRRWVGESPWTPKRRLVLSNTLRAYGPKKKMEIRPAGE